MSKVVVMVSDMIFSTKISSCAQAVGTPAVFARSLDEFKRIASETPPEAVIVDLEQDEALVSGLLEHSSQLSPQPKFIGFCPHVRQDVMDHAKDAGFDQVMTRSTFASKLPAILGEFVD